MSGYKANNPKHRKERKPFQIRRELRYLRYRLALWIIERKRRGGIL
jgi:hypothetical protein